MDPYLLVALVVLVLAMPIASLAVRGLDLALPDVGVGALAFAAALLPAALVLAACIARMNVRLYSEDWGQVGALYFAYAGVPLSLLLGTLAAVLTLRRVRRDREG